MHAQLGAPRTAAQDLAGARIVITAGGTREEIDPVRYLANHSSGKQGWALAHAALARGAGYQEAATEAAVASALTVTRPGAQDAIPTRADVQAALP